MTRDLLENLALDPRIQASGIEVTSIRFTLDDDDSDALGIMCDLAIAMRAGSGRWPQGAFRLQGYEADGLMVHERQLFPATSLDPTMRHINTSLYKERSVVRFELIFDPQEEAPALTEEVGQREWKPLPVATREADEQLLGVSTEGLGAEFVQHFDYDNQLLVRVAGRVTSESAFPWGLMGDITILDHEGIIRGVSQVALWSGPEGARSFDRDMTMYNHHIPSRLEFRLFVHQE